MVDAGAPDEPDSALSSDLLSLGPQADRVAAARSSAIAAQDVRSL
jgi:hypothetical protein